MFTKALQPKADDQPARRQHHKQVGLSQQPHHRPDHDRCENQNNKPAEKQAKLPARHRKNEIADAAARAMGCYEKFIWIAGGVSKEGGVESLDALFPRIAKAFLIGRDAPDFAATLKRHGVANDVVGVLEAAVPAAFAEARLKGVNVVLLSPACASFDQFKSFEHRGEVFATLVSALTGEAA